MAHDPLEVFFQRCLRRRVGTNQFRILTKQLRHNIKCSNKVIVSALLRCGISLCLENDPLLTQYLQSLLLSNSICISDTLSGLALQWRAVCKIERHHSLQKVISVYLQFTSALNIMIGNGLRLTLAGGRKSIYLAAKWLEECAQWEQNGSTKEQNANLLTQAVGMLLISLLSAHSLEADTSRPGKIARKAVQDALQECMAAFPDIAVQLMTKTTTLQKTSLEVGQDAAGPPSPNTLRLAAAQFESHVHDAPISPNRLATVVFLNQLLRTGATIEDAAVFGFLNLRYQETQGNGAAMFNEILLASFDAMTKSTDATTSMYRDQCQTFLLNKLPGILSLIVGTAFEGFPTSDMVADAFNYLSSLASVEATSTGQRFLQICAFYELISNDVVVELTTGEHGIALPGLYVKDDLVAQVTSNYTRGPRLVEQLLKNDGNANAISQAMMDVMHVYAHTKETQHLKDMANAIVRKPAAINVIAMTIQPAVFLGPLCSLLDEWKWEEIHGESQPVYDEFGSILLLVVAFQRRLGLKISDLGLQHRDSFLLKYLVSMHADRDLSKLSEAESSHLDSWFKALYVDESLSDELTTKCSAQDFYLLVPTLLRQSALALSRGKLSVDTLRAGLDYLLEPFLLPSLLSAFAWVDHIGRREPKTASTMIQIFSKQLASLEAREVHQTIVEMALEQFELHDLSKDLTLEPLISSLNEARDPTRRYSLGPHLTEAQLSQWNSTEGGISVLLSKSVASQATATEPFPLGLMTGAVQILGPMAVTRILLGVLIHASNSPDFHSLLDFIVTLITIHDIRLRHALQALHANLGAVLLRPSATPAHPLSADASHPIAALANASANLLAEAIVRLHRRVEAYSQSLRSQDLGVDHSFVPMAGSGMTTADLNLDAAAAAAAATGVLGAVPGLESSATALSQSTDIDQVINEAAAAAAGAGSAVVDGIDVMNDVNLDEYNFDIGNLDELDMSMF